MIVYVYYQLELAPAGIYQAIHGCYSCGKVDVVATQTFQRAPLYIVQVFLPKIFIGHYQKLQSSGLALHPLTGFHMLGRFYKINTAQLAAIFAFNEVVFTTEYSFYPPP